MRRRNIYFLILAVGIFIVLIFASGYYLFFTTSGSSLIIKSLFSRYIKSSDIDIKEIDGSISQTISLKDIVIEDLKGLPQGSMLEIKKIDASIKSLSLDGINFNINNARLNIPGEDPLFFYGTCEYGSLDFNIYTKSIDIQTIIGLLEGNRDFKKVSGIINNLDIYARGPLVEPEIIGEFEIEKLSRDVFSVVNCPGSFNLKFKDIMSVLKIYGEISFNSGSLFGPKTAVIKFQESKVFFNGDPTKPSFDLKGVASVADTKINIILKGTMDRPDLRLTSEPPLSKERLLLRLATNRSWQGTDVALNQGQMSLDIAKDFIDYFVFSGSGSRMMQSFGIKDVSLKYDNGTKGVGVKKDISDKAELSYAVEQSQKKDEPQTTTQKVGSEYKVTDTVAIGAERELKYDTKIEEQAQDKTQTDDKVFLKYKKQF